jgi:vitamin B12 transporter
MRRNHSVCIATVVTMGFSAIAGEAQVTDSTKRDTIAAHTLPAVITTSRRYSLPEGEVAQRIDVISSTDLKRVGATDVADGIKKLAGVDVIQYPGLLSGIGIRGFRPQTSGISQRTLVLIDGRPSGAYNLSLIGIGMVERIEVLKGPASSLYGSSAMGGTINIITRRSAGVPFAGSIASSYGSFRTTENSLQAGGVFAKGFDLDLTLRHFDQGSNYRVGAGSFFRDLVGSDSALKTYPDGSKPARAVPDVYGSGATRPFTTFATRSGSLRLGYNLSPGVRLETMGAILDANDVLNPGDIYWEGTASDGSARKNVAHKTIGFTASALGRAHELSVRTFASREETGNYDAVDPGSFISFASRNSTSGAQLQDVLSLKSMRVLSGIDYSFVRATSHRFSAAGVEIGTFNPNSQLSSIAAFGELRKSLFDNRLSLSAGTRLDHITLELLETPFRPDVLGGSDRFVTFNPSGGVRYSSRNGITVHATAGRAFVAPDAFGRAGLSRTVTQDIAAYTIGNSTLLPEHSTTMDAGIGFANGRRSFDGDITYFATHVRDRITRARASFPAGSRPTTSDGTEVGRVDASVNSGSARIRGLEATLNFDTGPAFGWKQSLRIFAGATRIFDAQERTPQVAVDVERFANAGDFDPAQIFDALIFGPGATNTRIRNVSELSVNGGIEYDDRSRLTARLSTRYAGKRLDSDFRDAADVSDIEYPAFLVADLFAGVRIARQYSIDALITNITDENYYEKRGYNLAGRQMKLRLVVSF